VFFTFRFCRRKVELPGWEKEKLDIFQLIKALIVILIIGIGENVIEYLNKCLLFNKQAKFTNFCKRKSIFLPPLESQFVRNIPVRKVFLLVETVPLSTMIE